MTIAKVGRFFLAVISIVCAPSGFGQGAAQSSPQNPALIPRGMADVGLPEYLLGPDDQVKIWALGIEEISATPQRIDPSGYVDLPHSPEPAVRPRSRWI